MAPKQASGVDNTFRKTWDKAAFAEKAKEKEKQEDKGDLDPLAEARKRKRQERDPLHQGLIVQRANLKARDFQIDLAANLHKQTVHSVAGPLSGQAGYYCEVCDCVLKDSMAYLDHINGKWHNRALGMSMRVEKSTADQVRKRLEVAKRQKRGGGAGGSGRDEEDVHVPDGMVKEELQAQEKAAGQSEEGEEEDAEGDPDLAAMMGFGGFGGSNK